MDQRIIKLYDEYTHKPLTRKEFMQQLVMLTGSTAAAMSVLPFLESDYQTAKVTTEGELFTEYITYPGAQGQMKAYVARPEKKKKIRRHHRHPRKPRTQCPYRRCGPTGSIGRLFGYCP